MIAVARGTGRVVCAALAEIRMLAGLLRGQSMDRVELKQSFQEIGASFL